MRYLVLASCLVAWTTCQQQQQQPVEYLRPEHFQTAQTPRRYYDPRYIHPEEKAATEAPTEYHTYPPAPVHYVNIGEKLEGDYKFGYDTGDGPAGQSYREEVRLADGTVKGSYGYVDSRGRTRRVHYIAGKDGFQVVKDEIIKDKTGIKPPDQQDSPQPSKQSSAQPVQQQLQRYPTNDAAQPKSSQELQLEYFRKQLLSQQSVNQQSFVQPEQQQPFQLSLQQPAEDGAEEQPAPPRRQIRKRKRLRRPTTTTTTELPPPPPALPSPLPPRVYAAPPNVVDSTHILLGDGYGQRISGRGVTVPPVPNPTEDAPQPQPEQPQVRHQQPHYRRQFVQRRQPEPQEQPPLATVQYQDESTPPPTRRLKTIRRTRRPTTPIPATEYAPAEVQTPDPAVQPARRRRIKIIRVPQFLAQPQQTPVPVPLTTPPSVPPVLVSSAPEPIEPTPTFPSAEQSFFRTHGTQPAGPFVQQRVVQQAPVFRQPAFLRPQQSPFLQQAPLFRGPATAPQQTHLPIQQEQPRPQVVPQQRQSLHQILYPQSANYTDDISVLNVPIPGRNQTNTFADVPALPPPPAVNVTAPEPYLHQFSSFPAFPSNQNFPGAAPVFPPQPTFQAFPANQFNPVPRYSPPVQQPYRPPPAAATPSTAQKLQQPRADVQQRVVQPQYSTVQQPVDPYQQYSPVPSTLFSPLGQTNQQSFVEPFQAEFSAPYQYSSPYQYDSPVAQYQAPLGQNSLLVSPFGSSSNSNPTVVGRESAQQKIGPPVVDKRLLSYSIGVSPYDQ